jgi:electron transfer flavoprotein alpha subunit
MDRIGVVIETDRGELKRTNFGVITAARRSGAELYALLPDEFAASQRPLLEKYGIDKIIPIVSTSGEVILNPASRAKAVIQTLVHFDIRTLLGLSSPRGKDLLPRVAAELEAPLAMDCTAVDTRDSTAVKSHYSGKLIARFRLNGNYRIYGLRPNAVEAAAAAAPAAAGVIPFQARIEPEMLQLIESTERTDTGADLSEADVIVSGGRGMAGPENFALLFECADRLQGAVGASRAAVDAGWIAYAHQVGQTGQTVSPKVYIACGISGSVQHFAGMKTAGMVIAINTDREAPIVQRCDYFAVADLFDVLPALIEKLKGRVGGR